MDRNETDEQLRVTVKDCKGKVCIPKEDAKQIKDEHQELST